LCLDGKMHHPLYADAAKLASDLTWLECQGMMSNNLSQDVVQVEAIQDREAFRQQYEATYQLPFNAHTYSDCDRFTRLITIIRAMLHYPFFNNAESDKNLTDAFCAYLEHNQHLFMTGGEFRKDIERVLNPYRLLEMTPDQQGRLQPMQKRRGYFVGAAVLTKEQLLMAVEVLERHAKDLQDPIAEGVLEEILYQLELSRIYTPQKFNYPLRAMSDLLIVNMDSLPDHALARQRDLLSQAIRQGSLLEVDMFKRSGRPETLPHGDKPFCIYPLQLVFHTIGWYLGYETIGSDQAQWLRFERLDRLRLLRVLPESREQKEQYRRWKQLRKLQEASFSLFLGSTPQEQQQFLRGDPASEFELELWASEQIFRYLAEGNKRFPAERVKLSCFPDGSSGRFAKSQIDRKKRSTDPARPYHYRVRLPRWSIQDWDLRRWLVGFGKEVWVQSPLGNSHRGAKACTGFVGDVSNYVDRIAF
jgi:hypothetical protein